MRKVILIRHAKSTGGRYDRHLFPPEGAPLSDDGVEDAKKLRGELQLLDLDVSEKVAVSQLVRTQQTAMHAGLLNQRSYETLNEVNSGLEPEDLEELISKKEVPEKAIDAASKLLNNPPKENIWVTHGMLIAAIGEVLGIEKDKLFIPDMASLTEIEI